MKSFNMVVVRLSLVVLVMTPMGSSAFAQDDGQDADGVGIQTLRVFTSGGHFFKRVLTEDQFIILNPGAIGADGFSAWVNLPGAGPARRDSRRRSPGLAHQRPLHRRVPVRWRRSGCGLVQCQGPHQRYRGPARSSRLCLRQHQQRSRWDGLLGRSCDGSPPVHSQPGAGQSERSGSSAMARVRRTRWRGPAVPARRLEPHDRERQSELPVGA